MYSVYKLNKQGDNRQPWRTPFPILNQSVVPCPALTVASWPIYRFLKRNVRWSGIPSSFKTFPQFVVIHTVKGCSIVSEAEVVAFLKLPCFLHDLTNVGNLISGLSTSSSPSLYILYIRILLKPSLKDFERNLASMWKWAQLFEHYLALPFFGIGNENWPFPVLRPLLRFPNLLAYWVQHFNSIIL